jgi:hypothetical protein
MGLCHDGSLDATFIYIITYYMLVRTARSGLGLHNGLYLHRLLHTYLRDYAPLEAAMGTELPRYGCWIISSWNVKIVRESTVAISFN